VLKDEREVVAALPPQDSPGQTSRPETVPQAGRTNSSQRVPIQLLGGGRVVARRRVGAEGEGRRRGWQVWPMLHPIRVVCSRSSLVSFGPPDSRFVSFHLPLADAAARGGMPRTRSMTALEGRQVG